MDLNKVFRPKSMAIVGANDKVGSFGNYAAVNALEGTNSDRVYLVNNKRDSLLGGRKCYPDLASLPELVDCVVIATPNTTVPDILEEAGRMGIGGAVIFASGFSEERSEKGKRLEQAVINIAKKYDMAVLGPNCMGLMNNVDHIALWGLRKGDFSFSNLTGAALVGQSGFLIGHLQNSLVNHGVSYTASTGNGNVITVEDCMNFYVDDDSVKVISVYLEGVRKPKIFELALRKAAMKRKPVVILKGGKSAKGVAGAASHTGSLAGSAKAYEAVFEKYGVVVVEDLVEFIAATQMFVAFAGLLPHKPTVASMNLSGGENTICADNSEKWGLVHPDFNDELTELISAAIPEFATCSNPLDATTKLFHNEAANKRIIKALLASDDFGVLTIGMNLGIIRNPVLDLQIRALCAAIEESEVRKPIFVVPSFEASRDPEYVHLLAQHSVMVTPGGEKAYKLISLFMKFAAYDYRERTLGLALPTREIENPVSLSEYESKEIIRGLGIQIPAQTVAADAAELEIVLAQQDYPVVMKINSPDIPHKTEAGGVLLNIRNAEEARQAYGQIMKSCRDYEPNARLNGVIVQEMVKQGLEFIIGVSRDQLFGPMILVGLGGVFVEVFQDAVLYPAPLNKTEAMYMLRRLKAWRLLEGYRGSGSLDVNALCDVIVKVGDYAARQVDKLSELDLNPVFVYEKGEGLCVADALIIKEP